MELINFKGIIYGKLETQLFVWEASWDSFRPLESIGWNGREIMGVDTKYKHDIFDPYYGYGTPEMKKLCRRLTDITELNDAKSGIPWLTQEFWRDRKCSFAFDCSSRSPQSWKKYIAYTGSRAKTLRIHRDSRATKRLLPK